MRFRRIIAAWVVPAWLALAPHAHAQKVVSSWQGTMTLSAGVYTPITSANVTMAAGSQALPATFGTLTVINTGTNPLVVCWFSSTTQSTSGCETLGAGASDSPMLSLGSTAVAPTLYSASGTTVTVRGGN
jgi:hypothetical protein